MIIPVSFITLMWHKPIFRKCFGVQTGPDNCFKSPRVTSQTCRLTDVLEENRSEQENSSAWSELLCF